MSTERPTPPTPRQIAELAARVAAIRARGPLALAKTDSYSPRYLRFVLAHWETFKAAELDQSSSSSSEMARLSREFVTLPSRHYCTCRCPQEGCQEWGSPGHDRRTHACNGRPGPPCTECKRLRVASVKQDVARGVSSRHPCETGVVPLVVVLDLEAGFAA